MPRFRLFAAKQSPEATSFSTAMTKLQKRPPPAYPGLSTNTIDGEGGIRYESLPQDTQQPIPLAINPNQFAVSGALGNNNPYNTQQPSFQVFSPVSPMDVTEASRASVPASQIHAPQPHRRSMDARKSVELRRLDGRPYDPEQGKKVKVAKDMHEGALPPAYKRVNSDPINPTAVSQALGNGNQPRAHHCTRPSCTKCGKNKSPASSAPHSRAVSQGTTSSPRPLIPSVLVPRSPVVAGPSNMPQGQQRCCHKCGKKKKPATAPLQQDPFRDIPQAPNSAPLPEARLSRPSRPGVSIQQAPNVNGVNPHIDVIPPSASTYHPHSIQSPYSQYGDETPLVGQAQEQRYSLFQNSSIVRSLSHRLSGRDKRASDGPLPSQQLRASQMQNGEQGTGRLINMISKAINDSGENNNNNNHQQYARLSAHEQPSRPSSPFSFMETPNDNEGYEMKDMKDGKGKATSPTSPSSEPSIYSPIIIEETLDVDVDRRSRMMEQNAQTNPGGLGVPDQQDGNRPPLTRFKSLRQGVNRAASVTRATSLRRFESLKTVHTAWYRDDLAIEGHNGESVPVF